MNNTKKRSIGTSPSQLLFGLNQKGTITDKVRLYLIQNSQLVDYCFNLDEFRHEAQKDNLKVQNYNKCHYDKKHKTPFIYKEGDYILIKNTVVKPVVNKK